MSRAKRTVRTTAAAAGIAALGVGLAGNALAAPSAPAPDLEPVPALPQLPELPVANVLATLPGTPSGPALPMLFVFEGPTVNTPSVHTAGPTRSAAPVQTTFTAAPDSDVEQRVDDGPAPAASTVPGADQVGALSALDAAGVFSDVLPSSSVVDQHGLGTGRLGLDYLG